MLFSERQPSAKTDQVFIRKSHLSVVRVDWGFMVDFKSRIHLATLALFSFMASFIAARTFTSFYPNIVLISSGLHIHHFWFGIVLLAVGGWLGISFNHKEIEKAAAIIYGVGGGLIVDEVGLLLTFGNYWSGLTWTILIVLLSFFSVVILFSRYRQTIIEELKEFVSSKASLYFAVFLAVISIAFIAETDSLIVTVASAVLTVIAVIVVFAFLVNRTRKSPKK